MEKLWGIVAAAGQGKRLLATFPKQYLRLQGRYLIDHSLAVLLDNPRIESVTVSLSDRDAHWHTSEFAQDQRVVTCVGGERREHSVWKALQSLQGRSRDDDWVLVHDAARPLLDSRDLASLIKALHQDPVGGILASPVADSLKLVASGTVVKSLARETVYRAQTPQMFRYRVLFDAMQAAVQSESPVLDESAAVEKMNLPVRIVASSFPNDKITYPQDLELAQAWIKNRDKREL